MSENYVAFDSAFTKNVSRICVKYAAKSPVDHGRLIKLADHRRLVNLAQVNLAVVKLTEVIPKHDRSSGAMEMNSGRRLTSHFPLQIDR
ncbi:MAG: hypothetical protein ACI9HK_005341 [Pirellulaceae bacterium]|jgi:hypothetical protein